VDGLYVCDTDLNTVMIYDLATGEAHRLKGDSGAGKIRKPNGLDFSDDGRMFIADKLRGSVLVYGPDEAFVGAWGRPGRVAPVSVAVGKKSLYVCDIQDHEIEQWDLDTGAFLSAFGGQGHEPGLFSLPTHVTLDAKGHVYVSDTGNFRVQKLSSDGKPLQQFGGAGRQPGRFAWPKGEGTDGQGRVYVADSRFCNVQIFDAQGRLLLFFGGPGPEMGNLDLPASVQVVPWPMLDWFDQRVAPGSIRSISLWLSINGTATRSTSLPWRVRGGNAMRRWKSGQFALALGVALVLLSCATENRREVLHFFFDGVPPASPPVPLPRETELVEVNVEMKPAQDRVTSATLLKEANVPARRRIVVPQKGTFHLEMTRKQCLGCHDADKGLEPNRTVSLEFCDQCHREKREKEGWNHGVINMGQCSPCHVAGHTAPYFPMLDKPIKDLCAYCHIVEGEVEGEIQPWYHRPLPMRMEMNNCTACHDPHRI
jgi:predicted CXXCH cytochrome family protein